MTDQTHLLGRYKEQILTETDKIYKAYRKAVGIKGDRIPKEFKYPEEGAITSAKDEEIIRSLVDGKRFLILNSKNTVYTLGLWLLYGLPELVMDVSKIAPSNPNVDGLDDLDDLDDLDSKEHSIERFHALDSRINRIVFTYIHDLLPTVHRRLEQSESGKIHMRRFYDQENIELFVAKDLSVDPTTSDNITETVRLKLTRVPEEEYISLDADYMIWFYSYYMKAEDNRNIMISEEDSKVIEEHDGIEYQVYPIYRTTFKYDDFEDCKVCNAPVNTTPYDVQNIVDKYIENTYSDFSEDSFDGLDSESSE